ncbi:MAG: amidohydrolase [Anaerolineales bacterium]|nr:amidohydrolase [Anaerolineales bacterium]
MTHPRLAAAQAIKPFIVDLRRRIHRQPELGFDVHKTAALVARTLGELGIETQTGVGKTGVVAVIGDGEGPVVGIRADMDALPILEDTGLDFASEVSGKMHACGHDAHTAMLLGAAKLLSTHPIHGQIRLFFQPSEEIADDEGISGAPRMIDDGALKGVDRVIALHVDGENYVGQIEVGTGQVSAAVDTFFGHVIGTGGHGARPQVAIDPIWLSTHVLNALYAIPSRRIDPFQPSVLSLGVVRGGEASNVIPRSVYIEGTLRSMDSKVRETLITEVERCFSLARVFGGDYTLKIERGYPSMHNHAGVAETIEATARELLGPDSIVPAMPTMGAEDFSYMTELAPGAMFMLGVRKPGIDAQRVHTPTFMLDEDALPLGSAMLAETALRLLEDARQG